MSDRVTLDHIDFQTIKDRAGTARAEYMRQRTTAASVVAGSTLRTHPVIAVVAVLIISFGVRMFFFSAPTAQAEMTPAVPRASMNILQMHLDYPNNLPEQQMNDMTFVTPFP